MLTILTLIGCIGLFLYGINQMSEGLQKIVGDRLRSMLSWVTRNRVTSMVTGMLLTALIQSSKATTLTMVSFVNAGIISLRQAMAFILGANVGTTATAWMIALVGFNLDLGFLTLPLIALAFPLFSSKHDQTRNWGGFALGFALMFLSLTVVKEQMQRVNLHEDLLVNIYGLCTMEGQSLCLFVGLGIVLTVFVQASNVMFVVAALLCSYRWITFDMACALMIGSNIGTCLTPLLASRHGNSMAKRAAAGHLLINMLGAVWAIALFRPSMIGLSSLCRMTHFCSTDSGTGMPLALALYHTLFNLINVSLLLCIHPWLVKAVSAIVKSENDGSIHYRLQMLGNGFDESGEMALLQVRKQVCAMGEETAKMFSYARTLTVDTLNSERQQNLFETIRLLEERNDEEEEEIASYLNKIKGLSNDSELLSRSYYKVIDELESIADSIYHIACTLNRKYEHRCLFTPEQKNNLKKMFDLTEASLTHMQKCLETEDLPESALNKAYNIEDEINNLRSQLRSEMIVAKGADYQQASYFMDLINECERVGDFVINITVAMSM